VYSGVLKTGDFVYNSRNGKTGALAAWCRCTPNDRTEIKEVCAGDIAACVGIEDVYTGTTLASTQKPVVLERMVFPEPVISQGGGTQDQGRPGKDGHGAVAPGAEDPSFACAR